MTATITMSNYIFNTNTDVYSKLVYAAIKKFSNNEGKCFPARNTLAQLCKISLSSLRKAINSLVDAQVLEKAYRYRENRSQTSNLYTLAPFMISGDYYFNVRADIFELGLTEIETVIYMYLCSCANKDNECYPSMSRIAAACGVSQTSAKKAIKGLCEKQLIMKANQFREDGGKRNNLYRLLSESIDITQDEIELSHEFVDEVTAHEHDSEVDDLYADYEPSGEEQEEIKIEGALYECKSLDTDTSASDFSNIEKKKTSLKMRGDIFDFKLSENSLMVYLYMSKFNALERGKYLPIGKIARNCKLSKAKTNKALLELSSYGVIETYEEMLSNPMVITEPPPWSI